MYNDSKNDYSSQGTILLGVNVDHVATIRQSRGTVYPDPVQAAAVAEMAGADGITIHLREDRRHIQERDVRILSQTLATRMNLEMALTQEMLNFALEIAPACCCIVPERREELTTEGGLDVLGKQQAIADACSHLSSVGVQVSLFIDPEPEQIRAAKDVGAPTIELHTGRYADAENTSECAKELQRIADGVQLGRELGLIVNAGHGLNYHNTQAIVALPGINELNIGHSIIARALFTGLDQAVREMRAILDKGRCITI
jgi:pyridoxine 5-phosphate synthase